jgi:hypothetical protein
MEREPLKLDAFFAVAGNNTDFVKQLLLALSEEVELFQKTISDVVCTDSVENFRKAAHKIQPGLKMLEQTSLLDAIDRYKDAYTTAGEPTVNVSSTAHNLRNEVALLLDNIRFFCNS